MKLHPFACVPLIASVLLCAAGFPSHAQTRPTTNAVSTNQTAMSKRWLFIIETSSAMKARKGGLAEVLRGLLESEMNNQLQPGDTVGVWTFNRQLFTGKLPVQRWTLADRQTVGMKILDFVQAQKFEEDPNLTAVTTPLAAVSEKSEILTAVLLSSGQGEITGTPFDAAINEGWATWRQARSKKPLVTILRADHGRLTQYRVTSADYTIEFPPLPQVAPVAAATKPAAPLATVTSTQTNKPAPSQPVGALVFSGPNKREPRVSVGTTSETQTSGAPANVATVETPPGTVSIPAPSVTSNLAAGVETKPEAPVASNVVAQAAVAPVEPSVSPSPAPAPAPETPAPPPAKTSGLRMLIYAAAALLLLLVIVAMALMRSRGKSHSPGSIISESVDDRKR